MQDTLGQLGLPIIIGAFVFVLVLLLVIALIARRARQDQLPALGQPPISEPVDYTSLPLDEEPKTLGDRFRSLSLASKALVVLTPLVILLGLIALALVFLPGDNQQVAAEPTPVPVTVTVRDAVIVRADPLTLRVTMTTTGLADGDVVTIEMLEDGQPFAWIDPTQAQAVVRNNRAELEVERAKDAPMPQRGRTYAVIARAADGTQSEPTEVEVPSVNQIAETFFGEVAIAPTATPTVIQATPTPTATAAATPTSEPTATPAAQPTLPTGPTALVGNGGNVRRHPLILADNVVAGVNAGETVQLISRTPNGLWFYVRTIRDEIGWVSASLLVNPYANPVPVASWVTVFVTGAVYERPDFNSTELDRVNQGEVVELTGRTAAGDWYAVVNVRDVRGWTPAQLLGIPPEVAAAVPVQP